LRCQRLDAEDGSTLSGGGFSAPDTDAALVGELRAFSGPINISGCVLRRRPQIEEDHQ
jgi:hypothetical protein